MKLLDALNLGLRMLQSPTVTTEDSTFPMVGQLRQFIELEMQTLFARGLWFNSTSVTLTPGADGKIVAPSGMLTFYTNDPELILEDRDGYMYNLSDDTPYFSSPVKGELVIQMPFQDIPEWPAKWITWLATSKVYVASFGSDDGTYQRIMQYAMEAQVFTDREHLRKKHYSSLHTGAARNIISALRT